MENCDITMSPVGYVRVSNAGFELAIEPQYRAALVGLEGFSHINVIWWSHFLAADHYRSITECEQPYKNAPTRLGLFATRSPLRPNPICVSVSPVIHIDAQRGILSVAYIDAEDGTPILDIKPYQPSCDRVRDPALPDWCTSWPQWFEDSAEFDWDAIFINAS